MVFFNTQRCFIKRPRTHSEKERERKQREREKRERATRILWLQTQKHHRFSSINDKVRILLVTLKVFTHYNKLVWTKVWSHAPLLIYILLHLVPYFYCIIYNKKWKWMVKYLPYCFFVYKGWRCDIACCKRNFEIHIFREKRMGIEFHSVLSCTEASLFYATV